MPGILDVHVATFQLRSELMINHFKQLTIIYNGTFGRGEKNICQYILRRNSDICRRVSPNSDNEGYLLEKEMQTVIDRWQKFAENDELKLYYGERFFHA